MSSKYFGFCCLLFVFCGSSACYAGDFNYGDVWNVWDAGTREVYLTGLVDGVDAGQAFFVAAGLPLASDLMQTSKRMAHMRYDTAVISAMMTALYGDKKNAVIPFEMMAFIARDRVSGADVTGYLDEQRRRALGR